MAQRKPGNDHEFYWRMMSALQRNYGEFTQRILVEIAGQQHQRAIEGYLNFLAAEKVLLATRSPGVTAPYRYSIVNAGEAPPHSRGYQGGADRQQALWTAMRSLRSFAISELELTASTEELPVSRATAVDYVRALLRAGYLRPVGQAPRQKQTTIFALAPARNTGPRAPIVARGAAAAFDLNLMRSVNLNAPETAGRAA